MTVCVQNGRTIPRRVVWNGLIENAKYALTDPSSIQKKFATFWNLEQVFPIKNAIHQQLSPCASSANTSGNRRKLTKQLGGCWSQQQRSKDFQYSPTDFEEPDRFDKTCLMFITTKIHRLPTFSREPHPCSVVPFKVAAIAPCRAWLCHSGCPLIGD